MAVHHLISIEGMAKSGLGELIEDKGYDINWKENLIFIPYELEGACHLGVQLHRGNHTKKDVNQRNYHEMVTAELEKKLDDIEKCEATAKETLNKLTKTLNGLSAKIVEMIEDYEVNGAYLTLISKPARSLATYQLVVLFEVIHSMDAVT